MGSVTWVGASRARPPPPQGRHRPFGQTTFVPYEGARSRAAGWLGEACLVCELERPEGLSYGRMRSVTRVGASRARPPPPQGRHRPSGQETFVAYDIDRIFATQPSDATLL